MSELTIYLCKDLSRTTCYKDLADKAEAAIKKSYSPAVKVSVSVAQVSKPDVQLNFDEIGPLDTEDVDVIIDDVVDAIAFYYGDALNGRKIGITMHAVIEQLFEEIEIL